MDDRERCGREVRPAHISEINLRLPPNGRLEEELRADVGTPVEFDFRTGATVHVDERHEVVGDVVVGADGEFEPVVVEVLRERVGAAGHGRVDPVDVAAEVAQSGHANVRLPLVVRAGDAGHHAHAADETAFFMVHGVCFHFEPYEERLNESRTPGTVKPGTVKRKRAFSS